MNMNDFIRSAAGIAPAQPQGLTQEQPVAANANAGAGAGQIPPVKPNMSAVIRRGAGQWWV